MRTFNIAEMLGRIIGDAVENMPTALQGLTDHFADVCLKMWTAEARAASASWGENYASTLKQTSGNLESSVFVDDASPNVMFVNMMENGVKSWSIKDALLAGKAAARNEAEYGTRFVRVPFQHATPTKNKVGSRFSSVLPDDVYQRAKAGEKIGNEAGFMKAGWKASNLSGLKRYGAPKHGMYFTFRTVSEKSQGWQHPGHNATPVFEPVVKKMEAYVEDMVEKFVIGLVDDFESQAEKLK